MSLNLLVVAAHPDDEIAGCGGMIAKAIKQGHKVHILYLSSGDSSESTREKEAKAVCSFLKIASCEFLRLKDQTFKVSAKNIEKISKYWNKVQPDIVYINHEMDGDFEHKIAYRLIAETYWRYNLQAKKKTKGLVLYEVHKPMQTYNLTEDISDYLDVKMKAMSFYASQIKKSRLDLAIRGLNQYRGIMHEECDFAEVFKIKRWSSLFANLQ